MANVVFCVKVFLARPSSTGIVVSHVARELVARGHTVTVITGADPPGPFPGAEGVEIRSARARPAASTLLERFSLTRRFLNRCFRPSANRYVALIQDLHQSDPIDLIICMHQPIVTLSAGLRVLQMGLGPRVAFVLFDFAIESIPHDYKRVIRLLKMRNFFRQFWDYADHFLVLETLRAVVLREVPAARRAQITFFDLPAITEYPDARPHSCAESGIRGPIHLLYAGQFYKRLRNPQRMFEILSECIRRCDTIFVDIYSFGCDDIVAKFESEHPGRVIRHPVIDHSEVRQVMSDSSALLNLSNTLPASVPGKVLEILSSGRPALSFVQVPHDQSRSLFDRYPISFEVRLFEEYRVDELADRIINWLNANVGRHVSFETVRHLYSSFTPSAFADLLENHCLGAE